MGEAELEILTEQQCLEYLHAGTLGRIAFSAGPDVEIFPVNYTSDGAIVVFRTSPGTKLDGGLKGRVAFEVDGWDPAEGVGWSVVIKGVATEVRDGVDPYAQALRARNVQPLAPGVRDRWVAVYPGEISGRRFKVRPEGGA